MINNNSFFLLSVKFEFNAKNRQRFYTKLAQLLENGVSLDAALLQIQTLAARSKGSVLSGLYGRWRKSVANGMNFGSCVGPYVPSSEAILLETGAASGQLSEALYTVARTVEQQSNIKNAIISNSAYPLLLFAMLIAALMLASYMVIPTFSEILPTEEWTGFAGMVAQATVFIRNNGAGIAVFMVMAIIIIAFSLPRWTGKSRLLVENMIPWSLYRMLQGSAFLLSISSMMSAGVKLDDVSLKRIGKSADPYLAERIDAVKRYITSGANLGDALYNTGYRFPDEEIIADLRIYARLRDFDKNLVKITRSWVEELVEKVSQIMKVLNVIVLFLIAVVIGVLISALYGVVQQIQVQT